MVVQIQAILPTTRACQDNKHIHQATQPPASPSNFSPASSSLYIGKKPRHDPILRDAASASDTAGFATAALAALGTRLGIPPDLASRMIRCAPQFHLLPARQLDERSRRSHLLRWPLSHVLSVQPGRCVLGATCTGHTPPAGTWCTGAMNPSALSPTPNGYDARRRVQWMHRCSGRKGRLIPTIIYTGVQPPSIAHRNYVERWPTQMAGGTGPLPPRAIVCVRGRKIRNPFSRARRKGARVTGFRDPCVWRAGNEWMMAIGSGFVDKG